MALVSVNPTTSEEIKRYPEHSIKAVIQILKTVSLSQLTWSNTNLDFRLSCLEQLIGVLKDKKREFASLISLEMGKPISQSEGEIEKCIWLCEYYFQNSRKILSRKLINDEKEKCYVTFQPIGNVLGVMPWNFPFWQVFRFAVPTIVAGNGAILKHSSNVQGCAYAIESCFQLAGFPSNIFRNLSIKGKDVKYVIESPFINAVSLTGSTPVGQSVAQTAGKYIKKTVLELGGSDPYIILEDANLNLALEACINGRILNTGQSCISAKRIIVVDKLYDEFLIKLEKKLSEKIMGDPMDNVDIGPMVTKNARDEVHNQVRRSVNNGASIILGGYIPNLEGAYYPLTLLSDVKPGVPAFDEEIFGPVFSVINAIDEESAIELANKTPFGLGAAVFTKNIKKGEKIASQRLEAGICVVNDFVKSDPRLPFGGIKESGYGRELSSYGMLEFVNVKTIVVNNG